MICVVGRLREFAAGFVGGVKGWVSLQGSVLGLWAGYSVGTWLVGCGELNEFLYCGRSDGACRTGGY